MRARASTDAVIPSRARFPTVTIASMDDAKALANYHQVSDTPENLDYDSVARATALSDEVIRALGRGEPA
jgi:Iap family predicted aminopeptidase